KYALVGTALAASGGAYADAVLPSTGNGQAVLFVKNETTGVVYARAFNLFVDNTVSDVALAADTYTGDGTFAGADTSFSFTLGTPLTADNTPGGGLQQFLTAPGGVFTWSVMAGDTAGTGVGVGVRRYLTTISAPGQTAPNNTQLGGQWATINT